MVGNRREQELDIVLLSTKDGTVVRNLTKGFDQGMGFAYIATPGGRWNTVSWMSWSPVGDRLAYFVRTEKEKALILQDVVSTDIKQRFAMKTVDEPESPAIAPERPLCRLLGAAQRHRRHLPARHDQRRGHQSHRRRVCRLRADVLARRQVHRLPGAHQRQREAVPLRPRDQEEDAADLRHARRGPGEVHRRPHAGVPLDGRRTRRSRSSPRSRATATSSTSGRST